MAVGENNQTTYAKGTQTGNQQIQIEPDMSSSTQRFYQFAEETHPRMVMREGSEDRRLLSTPSAEG